MNPNSMTENQGKDDLRQFWKKIERGKNERGKFFLKALAFKKNNSRGARYFNAALDERGKDEG